MVNTHTINTPNNPFKQGFLAHFAPFNPQVCDKNCIRNMLLALLFIACHLLTFGQDIKGYGSGSVGLINGKVRLQYELPISPLNSGGMNVNYYLSHWRGPVFEPFLRHYFSEKDHSEGFFMQGKFLYGYLSTDLISGETQRGSSYGFGIGAGYKFGIGDRFFLEPLIGYRQLSYPKFDTSTTDTDVDPYNLLWGLFNIFAWPHSTGSLFDFQFKLGYQF
jgi:hypothetical protein